MRTDQERRYSRVAEGIFRYKSGGFHFRHKVEGKTTWRKLKSNELQEPRCEEREILKNGILVQRNQPARMLAELSRDELARSSNAAEAAGEKVEGCHDKVLARRIDSSGASAKRHGVENGIADAAGACGANSQADFCYPGAQGQAVAGRGKTPDWGDRICNEIYVRDYGDLKPAAAPIAARACRAQKADSL